MIFTTQVGNMTHRQYNSTTSNMCILSTPYLHFTTLHTATVKDLFLPFSEQHSTTGQFFKKEDDFTSLEPYLNTFKGAKIVRKISKKLFVVEGLFSAAWGRNTVQDLMDQGVMIPSGDCKLYYNGIAFNGQRSIRNVKEGIRYRGGHFKELADEIKLMQAGRVGFLRPLWSRVIPVEMTGKSDIGADGLVITHVDLTVWGSAALEHLVSGKKKWSIMYEGNTVTIDQTPGQTVCMLDGFATQHPHSVTSWVDSSSNLCTSIRCGDCLYNNLNTKPGEQLTIR